MLKEIKQFEHGLTIKELKEILKDWPDEYEDGTPVKVWIETGHNLSSMASEVSPLNLYNGVGDLHLGR